MSELARFLFHSGDYSVARKMAKQGAFLPRNGKTSVFVIDGLDDQAKRSIGDAVGAHRGLTSRAGAELAETTVIKVGLRFVRDDIPERHGNILGWPDATDNKARLKDIAAELAQSSRLALH